MLGLSTLVGIVAGLAAIVFYLATQITASLALGSVAGYVPEPHPAGEPRLDWLPAAASTLRPWLLIVLPTIGGLASGWLVYSLAPEAEGHGTDSVIDAYHRRQGMIRRRVPLVKLAASALTLGSGGSGGREGPIAQIGAGFGSALATTLRLKPAERRVLMAAGMGAGIAAIFRAPLAGALFAAEVLYWSPEFEADVILPAALASVIAYCTFASVFGFEPLFTIDSAGFDNPWQLVPYTILAIVMVALATTYVRTFYGVTAWFRHAPVRRHLRPAAGALLTGVVGAALYYLFGRQERALSVLGFGYSAIQNTLSAPDEAGAWLLLAIALGKILTTSLTIGSGGSAGVFGPSMAIGACGGGAVGLALRAVWPDLVEYPSSFALVGMAGFFAAAAKTPFSTLIMVSEMTGGYQLLLPALWVCALAFMLSGTQSIYSSQVEGPAQSGAHQGAFVSKLLAGVAVGQLLDSRHAPRPLRAGDSLALVLTRFDEAGFGVLPVVDERDRLLGVINLEEVYLASQTPELRPLIVAGDLMRVDCAPLLPGDSLERAVSLFAETDLPGLPIVDNPQEHRLLGMVRRTDVASTYLRLLHGYADSPVEPRQG